MVTVGSVARVNEASHSELHDWFTGLDAPAIADLLGRLRDQVAAGRYPAGRPYRHVNGFTKIVMAEHPAARLTLHYWPAAPGAEADVSRPHDHRFGFSSFLLGGDQHFRELDETTGADGEPWRCFEYRPYLKGLIATVAGSRDVHLRETRTVRRAVLDGWYTTSSTVVHQAVTSRDQACVTLVLRGPRERRTSQVYYRRDEPPARGGLQLGRYLDRETVLRQVDHTLSLVRSM